ncbi:MAG: archease [Candidatus Aenigmarchaeota archaeon ex4484_224]|nr:MAG: archease [Candidatus Aenigmarchaeota archaeon ex4484_224]
MKKFEFIDITTADVAFLAYGKSLEEVFENSALAMFEVMVNTSKVEKKEERRIEAKGFDLESLLFDWLNELLFFYGSENLVFSEFKVKIGKKNEEFFLEGIAKGEKFDEKKHEPKTEVKAVTYHKMKIKKEDGIWKVRVILDI